MRFSAAGIAIVLLAGACGESPAPMARGALAYTRDCAGKPAPAIGQVDLVVVDRPSRDRVVLEARWERGPRGWGRRVELVLPEGAWLVEGHRLAPLKATAPDGVLRWTIGHETGRPLDAVVRLHAVEDGREVGREVCVPLE